MTETLKNIILMDGNGLFVWFCMSFVFLILVLNVFFAHRRKRKLLRSIKKI